MKKKNRPASVAFHGIEIRARHPEATARRAAAILGWPILRKNRSEIVLGEGPELFIRIVCAARGVDDAVAGLHLAVEKLSKSRRTTQPDALGGDSRSEDLMGGVTLTLREFKRAPGGTWRPKRKRD